MKIKNELSVKILSQNYEIRKVVSILQSVLILSKFRKIPSVNVDVTKTFLLFESDEGKVCFGLFFSPVGTHISYPYHHLEDNEM